MVPNIRSGCMSGKRSTTRSGITTRERKFHVSSCAASPGMMASESCRARRWRGRRRPHPPDLPRRADARVRRRRSTAVRTCSIRAASATRPPVATGSALGWRTATKARVPPARRTGRRQRSRLRAAEQRRREGGDRRTGSLEHPRQVASLALAELRSKWTGSCLVELDRRHQALVSGRICTWNRRRVQLSPPRSHRPDLIDILRVRQRVATMRRMTSAMARPETRSAVELSSSI